MLRPPFGQAGDDGAGLGDQCEVAGGRHVGRKASVEPSGGDHHAEAVGADKPQAVRPRGLLRSAGERVGAVADCGLSSGPMTAHADSRRQSRLSEGRTIFQVDKLTFGTETHVSVSRLRR